MERQVYQRRSFIPKVCIECNKEFKAQRKTAMYCGAGCLQAHRNRRLAGHEKTIKLTRATPIVNYPGQQQFQKVTEEQYIAYIRQLEQHINNMGFIMEDKINNQEKWHKEDIEAIKKHNTEIIEWYKTKLNELINEIKELRKMNKMWELASKVITGK